MEVKEKVCQSCALKMSDESEYGKKRDGSKTDEYCKYCFPNESFSKDESLEEMVESCIPFRINEYPNEETARNSIKRKLRNLNVGKLISNFVHKKMRAC